jgi:hypothetical protein
VSLTSCGNYLHNLKIWSVNHVGPLSAASSSAMQTNYTRARPSVTGLYSARPRCWGVWRPCSLGTFQEMASRSISASVAGTSGLSPWTWRLRCCRRGFGTSRNSWRVLSVAVKLWARCDCVCRSLDNSVTLCMCAHARERVCMCVCCLSVNRTLICVIKATHQKWRTDAAIVIYANAIFLLLCS